MADEVCIVTFPSTHAALRAERAAKEAAVAVRMIPVPRGISANCNMGMAAAIQDAERLRSLLIARGVEFDLVTWRKS